MSNSPDTTTTTSTGELPSYMENSVRDILNRGAAISNTPYQTYGGQRQAGFSADQQQAFDMTRNLANQQPTGIAQAQQTAAGLTGYTANPITTQDWTQANVQGYMNPYIQNVLDVQKQRSQQKFAEDQQTRDAQAVQAGAFGGNRRFVQSGLAQRDLNQQLQEQEATGLQSAYDRATQMFTSDQQRGLQAQMASEDARRAGAGLGLDAARTTADLDRAAQQYQLTGIQALSGIGAQQQQQQQQGLDTAYQDFLRQQNYPKENLSYYAGLLTGTPYQPSQTQSTTTPAPDFLSQLLGLAIGGAGIARSF